MLSTLHQTFRYLGTSAWFLTCRQNTWVTDERFQFSLDVQAYEGKSHSQPWALLLHVPEQDQGWCGPHFSGE